MADAEDLEALIKGENDLAERDLREADLSGMNLRGRDLSGAHLQKANLRSADLSEANLNGASIAFLQAQGANLTGAKIAQTAIVGVDFTRANFQSADLSRSHFAGVCLDEADLRGADFRNSFLKEGTTFTDAISDESTLFDGATIFRPLARLGAFRFYKVERGKLVRLPPETQIPSQTSPQILPETLNSQSILGAIAKAEQAIREAAAANPPAFPETPGIGHNQPPADAALKPEEVADALRALRVIRVEIGKPEPDVEQLRDSQQRLRTHEETISQWAVGKADIFAEAFAKSLGKEAAKAHFWVGIWLVASGYLNQLAELLLAILGR